jgi:hypothetical protein
MQPTEYCPSCNEGIVWKCALCEKENDKSVHTYHPNSDNLPRSIASPVVGALVCIASSFAFAI